MTEIIAPTDQDFCTYFQSLFMADGLALPTDKGYLENGQGVNFTNAKRQHLKYLIMVFKLPKMAFNFNRVFLLVCHPKAWPKMMVKSTDDLTFLMSKHLYQQQPKQL